VTALLVAAGVGYTENKVRGTEAEALEAVKLCAELGLDPKAATDKGETAMHGAALRGSDSIVKFLAEKGVDVNVKNKQGVTPLDVSMGKGGPPGVIRNAHDSTAALIRELGGVVGIDVKVATQAQN